MRVTIRITTTDPVRVSVHPRQWLRNDAPIARQFKDAPTLRALTYDYGSTVVTFEKEDER